VAPKHENYNSPDWEKYWEAQRAAEAACPVDIVSHCSGEYPMYIVAIRGTERTANRGSPEVIDPASLAVPAEKIEAAKAWCEAHRIEWQEPHWLLCSMWN
jgi:hypothetical protein